MLADHLPVLVGMGTTVESAGVDELLQLAVERALDDAGARRSDALLGLIGEIAIPRGSWSDRNPAGVVARRLRSTAPIVIADVGVPQQTLISRMLTTVLRGSSEAGLIVGVEARRWLGATGTAGHVVGRSSAPTAGEDAGPPDTVLSPHGEIVNAAEIAARVWEPVQQYALIDSALGHAEHRSSGEWTAEVDALWARWNSVAVGNPEARFGTARDTAALRSDEGGNRLLAHPYRRFHSTQWNLDQATALVITSVGAARRLGIPTERWIFPHVSLESSHSLAVSSRAELHRWPAMRLLGRTAATALGRPLQEIEHIELYSCFPAAVRVQERELGLDLARTHTITGGMPFAGGPFNHSTLWSTAAMGRRLREQGGHGLVTNVSGLLTKPGLAVWSTAPSERPLIADLADDVAAATTRCDTVSDYTGPATIAAATVVVTGGEQELIIIGDTPSGQRIVARGVGALAQTALDHDFVGHIVDVRGPSLTI